MNILFEKLLGVILEEITGYIQRIVFQNDENGFTVARLKNSEDSASICIVGPLLSIKEGETVKCCGEWKEDPNYGKQFEVTSFFPQTPTTLEGIKKYLGAGHIKGIGPTYAERIVKKFGDETLKIIDENPIRLLEVPGLGKKRLKQIKSCWQEQQSMRNSLIFLQSKGISIKYAQKIFKVYGEKCVNKIIENPYQLADDIFGMGFKKADEIARSLDISLTSDKRIDAGVNYVLNELASNGHVCYPLNTFISTAAHMLELPEAEPLLSRLQTLQEEKQIVIQQLLHNGNYEDFIWSRSLYKAERGISKEISRLQKAPSYLRKINSQKAIDWAESELNVFFAQNQKDAIKLALEEKLQIITGGPGTGKSTITKAIVAITSKISKSIMLAAPTGRAAKRLSEITGTKAQTIHSLLEADVMTGLFTHNEENRLHCDLIIVDEASMIDTSLMHHLLQAIPSTTRVIFIGDINQLPSVGPGNVLKNLIQSNIIAVTELNQIFRQHKKSKIITNAHNINKGVIPTLEHNLDSDFFFIELKEPEKIAELIPDLVADRLPQKYNFHPFRDIQVITPMKKGILGTGNLNVILQKRLNQNDCVIERAGKKLSIGDKVMQIRNNYRKQVFNGDVGYIATIDEEEDEIAVLFDNRSVYYEHSELDELVLAYAVSVHKYQGSECPCIVMPVHTTHFTMLQRNLLYTAVTRGKSMVVLVGTKKALSIAVRNDKIKTRHSGLLHSLVSP